ncbi:uncharacterized protein LOC130936444 [Arachis stenosperma]|uniref:uncharacterized protein LOC130936444 n=1 Tax=Arachis stenosperma TaxID=217475 RepID=UPI0025ACA0A9|nr:uncharacterized protein LOC130936444 [Arachis stenosperma]
MADSTTTITDADRSSSNKEPLLDRRKQYNRCVSNVNDEFRTFRSYLRWMCMDQSNKFTAALSWLVFLLFTVAVPAVSHFLLSCPSCDSHHSRPYDSVVQVSLSGMAAVSFLCLTGFVKQYGLRRFLFFDKLRDESETVRNNYMFELNRSLKIISVFVVPCFAAESAYKIWWYASASSQIPFFGSVYVTGTVLCILELCSWLYRTTVIFLVCILFRLICYLQILRLKDFATVFHVDSDVATVLLEHLRIRRHLRIISHRYRAFIILAIVLVTGSQLMCLLVTTKARNQVNIYKAGELALCSVTLLSALCILLRSATKITHRAQAITGLAAKWHVCATLDSFDGAGAGDGLVAAAENSTERIFPHVGTDGDSSDTDDGGDEEDDINSTKLIPSYAYSTISYQKRQALVNYFENNGAGITMFGVMLDRGTLNTIFGIEMSLVLWLLGKTIFL